MLSVPLDWARGVTASRTCDDASGMYAKHVREVRSQLRDTWVRYAPDIHVREVRNSLTSYMVRSSSSGSDYRPTTAADSDAGALNGRMILINVSALACSCPRVVAMQNAARIF